MLHKAYISELSDSLKYLPTWLPTLELQLGSLVIAEEGVLRRVGHVGDYRLAFTPRTGTSRATIEYSSAGGVSVTSKLAGQAVPGSNLGKMEAGLIVKFSRANAVVFEASGCTSAEIADLPQLGRAIKKLYDAGKWDRGLMLVSELIQAASVTIIISSGQAARIELKASGDVPEGGIKLSDLGAKLEAKHTRDVGFKIIASRGLTPFYRASGIKRTWLGEARFKPRSDPDDVGETYNFAKISQEDLFK
jgi:hypothetical protein